MKNDLRRTKLGASLINLYIASWDANNNAKGIAATDSNLLRQVVNNQLGKSASVAFESNFINYADGLILCTNTSQILNKFFSPGATSTAGPGVRFTIVKMPTEFIDQENSLTSKYAIGEKLGVRAGFETDTSSGVRKKAMTYRDSNTRGRSRLKTNGGGGGAGVWS